MNPAGPQVGGGGGLVGRRWTDNGIFFATGRLNLDRDLLWTRSLGRVGGGVS